MAKRNRLTVLFVSVSMVLLLILEIATASEDPAVTRTRQQVEMIDTLYKSAIVLITDQYVTDPSKFSGASAAKALFAIMKDNGFHEVRLVGLTDMLNNTSVNLFGLQAKWRSNNHFTDCRGVFNFHTSCTHGDTQAWTIRIYQ